ncbi:MAG: hypothetical protein WBI06_12570 [Paludibacter sp.]
MKDVLKVCLRQAGLATPWHKIVFQRNIVNTDDFQKGVYVVRADGVQGALKFSK